MDDSTVEVDGFTYRTAYRDGLRYIDSHWPEEVVFSHLSTTAWRFIEIYDSDAETPTITISDLSRVRKLSEQEIEIFTGYAARFATRPNHLVAVWYAENNPAMVATLKRMVFALVGNERGVYETRDDALAALERAVARRREQAGDRE